jgi:hypothetical protein
VRAAARRRRPRRSLRERPAPAWWERLAWRGGRDRLLGGAGVDTILALDARADVVDGGAGIDTGTLDRTLDRVTLVERRRYR